MSEYLGNSYSIQSSSTPDGSCFLNLCASKVSGCQFNLCKINDSGCIYNACNALCASYGMA